MVLEKRSVMCQLDPYLHFVCKFVMFVYLYIKTKTIFEYNLGLKEPALNNWQRIVIDIPNDKLILSVKEVRPSYMPTRIQALVIVRQRVNSIKMALSF